MNAKARARYEARARVMKALAHPTRLFIVDQLEDGIEVVSHCLSSCGGTPLSCHAGVCSRGGW